MIPSWIWINKINEKTISYFQFNLSNFFSSNKPKDILECYEKESIEFLK